METIRFLEELAFNAWPAEQFLSLGGWSVRYTHGYSRRANSVWPNAWWGEIGLEERLSLVEAFYRSRQLPPLYQICEAQQPGDLDRLLAERGFTSEGRTCVQVVELARALSEAGDPQHPGLELRGESTPEWLSVYAPRFPEPDPMVQASVRIFSRITPTVTYATLRLDDEPAAVGMGVLERGWLGIYCMATRPEFRRRGGAQAVLSALLHWGNRQGAEHAYLQVLEENGSARTLYERLGFATLYHYHYRRGR